jgi:hypothetical protein
MQSIPGESIKAPFLPKLIKRVEVVVCCPSAEFSEITLVFCSASGMSTLIKELFPTPDCPTNATVSPSKRSDKAEISPFRKKLFN